MESEVGDEDKLAAAREKIKAQYAGQDLEGSTEPTETGADDDLDGEIKEPTDDEPEPEPEKDSEEPGKDGEKDGGEEQDPDKVEQANEAKLLKSAGVVKLANGEYVPKATFIKYLQQERKRAKEAKEEMKKFERFQKDPARYDEWDRDEQVYRGSAKFTAKVHQVLQANSWLRGILTPLLEDKAPDYKALTNSLKPMLAPFWDGTEIEEPDPNAPVMEKLTAVERKLLDFERKEATAAQQKESSQRIAKRQEEYTRAETGIWARHPKYHDDLHRDLLYDRAAAIQEMLPEGQKVDLNKVADELFGSFAKREKEAAERRRLAAAKARRAAGEGGGRAPQAPIPAEKADPNKDPRDATKARMVERFGASFSA